ncbi:uncharacterized protein LOC123681787 [Harmonia axyridis]|uniref:uncharacterized protein LOC123681787 n=1 Tax=Harmonia axyridis TaxID=115357 RepID=UPI001E275A2A|nr:uncharacterized protein LOC123681787 [Harmonia axyridis]
MWHKIIVCVGVFLLFHTVSSLLCADNSAKGVNCSNGDVCFRYMDNVTKKITRGCQNPSVCKNAGDSAQCITCNTDMCNSGGVRIYLPAIFPVIMIALHVFNNS